MAILPVKRNPINGFTVVRCHYSADPEKDTKEWVALASRGMSERAWLREYEIDYSTYSGKPFFPEFSEFNIAKVPIEYVQGETLYRGWDFGFHHPCCVITRLNEFDQWLWMKAILGKDEGILDFGKRVVRYCQAEYPGAKYIDAADPAGMQLNDKSEFTSIQILNGIGVYPQTRKQTIKQGAEIIRQKLAIRVDGKPGILIDPRETDLIDGFKGGIHYPDVKEGKPMSEFYEKDGYYDHFFDSARYLSTEMFTVIGQTQVGNDISIDPMAAQYAMGRGQVSENTAGGLEYQENEVEEALGGFSDEWGLE